MAFYRQRISIGMLDTDFYRRDYEGELLHDGRADVAKQVLVKSKNLFFRENGKGKAIVIGNGISRINPQFDVMILGNKNRPIYGYKPIYACNGAIWDIKADYYVINNRVLLSQFKSISSWDKIFLPWDIFLDYKMANLIPLVSGVDAGTAAAFLACFDGNDEIFLFGFDGYNSDDNCYKGRLGYDVNVIKKSNIAVEWESNLHKLMRAYSNTKFYRVGSGRTPRTWMSRSNFQEISYKDAVFLGDF